MNSDDEADPSYLFVVEYDEDAERKRVEYLFNHWEEGTVEKAGGLVRLATDVDHDRLYEQLISKVPAAQVRSYRLEPLEPDVTPDTETVVETVPASSEAVESFVEYMLSKKKAVVQSAAQNEYEVYTKKGRAELTYRLAEADGATEVTLRITGYAPAPAFLADFFEAELADYANSQA